MLRSLYDWAMRIAAGPYALIALPIVAFIEATFPFVPPDVMLAPMVLARANRAWLYAGLCTVGSVLGGCCGYAIGFYASDVATHVLAASGHSSALEEFKCMFAKFGLAVILIKGLTPVPYMVITLASGVANFSLPVFIGASIVTRGGRFFLEATLLRHPHAKAFVDKHLTTLLIAGFVAIVVILVGLHMLEGHGGGCGLGHGAAIAHI
jgi:membrane protein YqaA with SNARE-associated domain